MKQSEWDELDQILADCAKKLKDLSKNEPDPQLKAFLWARKNDIQAAHEAIVREVQGKIKP